MIFKSCSLAMATSQLAENQQCSYEVFGKKHDMACTTQKRAAFQVMASKTMQCSPAFPLVLTSYKLLEIERTVIETCLTATLRPTPSLSDIPHGFLHLYFFQHVPFAYAMMRG